MKNELAQTPFTVEITEDGSPTLRLPGDGESMHHSGGAAAETEYIYKSVIETALAVKPDLKIAIVGLGLGYIEISWAISCLNLKTASNSHFVSFETDFGLKERFEDWLHDNKESIYDDVVRALDPLASIDQVKEKIKSNLKQLPLKGNLITDYENINSYNLICFDAFSRKTSEELWSEEFLTRFFAESAHENCILTTYACTGSLKRALKNNGFQLIERLRFKSNRESTLAVKGEFTSGMIFRTS